MAVESLHAHLVDELRDLLDAEQQLTKALPKMATSATTAKLKTAFQSHLKQTRGHVTRLNRALRLLDERPRPKTCEGMDGLLTEGEALMKEAPEGPLRDAVVITSAQKVEHYEMASYGTARAYAQVLGQAAVARLLEQTLKEEKAADAKLSAIAEASVNARAAEAFESLSADMSSRAERAANSVKDAVGSASRQLTKNVAQAARSMGLARTRSRPKPRGRTRSRSRSRQ